MNRKEKWTHDQILTCLAEMINDLDTETAVKMIRIGWPEAKFSEPDGEGNVIVTT